jgi:hypothetical protein
VRENIGNSMAHGFADAQLPLRSAACGIVLLVMTRHRCLSNRQCPHRGWAMTSFLFHQNDVDGRNESGHDASFQVSKRSQALRKIWTYSERWIVSTR